MAFPYTFPFYFNPLGYHPAGNLGKVWGDWERQKLALGSKALKFGAFLKEYEYKEGGTRWT